MIYFTSDLHFSHHGILKFSPKFRSQFKNIEEMDEALITMWNKVIKPEDDVYNLGDVCFSKDFNKLKSILRRLNGRHHLILGNHDHLIIENKEKLLKEYKNDGNPIFSSIQQYAELKINNQQYVLFHYPIQEWNRGHYGSIHLYGHIHDSIAPVKGKALNIGIDLHCKILSEKDVLEMVCKIPNFTHHDKNKIKTEYVEAFKSLDEKIEDKLESLKYEIMNKMKNFNK